MRFDVITLFPQLIEGYFDFSIMKRAKENDVLSINAVNPRDFSKSKHKKVDDTPYGGGAGMVLACEPFFGAYDSIEKLPKSKTIILTPQGKPFDHSKSLELAQYDQLIIFCGHYEGYDERIREHIDCEEISIGDFVLTGGELPALCIIDSVTRQVEGALGKIESAHYDSFSDGLLEYPQYTKPFDYKGWSVPEVLISGNHKEIELWRRKQQFLKTKKNRPDLFAKFLMQKHSKQDSILLAEIEKED